MMESENHSSDSNKNLLIELDSVKAELQEAKDIIDAIRTGSVDAIAVHGPEGHQIFTLKSADHTYRVLVEKMNEGAVILNKRREIIYCNSSFALFLEKPIQFIIGTSFNMYIHQSFIKEFSNMFDLSDKKSSKGEFMLRKENGQWSPYQFSMNEMQADDQDVYSVIITDISEKTEIETIRTQVKLQNKIIEQKNLELEKEKIAKDELERMKFVLEGIPQITWTNLPTGEVSFFNQRWYDYTQIKIEDIKNWCWKSFIHPDDLENSITGYRNSIATKMPYQSESRYRRASDGMYRWHLIRSLPVKNNVGEIIMWVGTATDIEDQKQAENKFRFIAETIPQIFWTATVKGDIDYFNQLWYNFTGLNFEQTNNWQWINALHTKDVEHTILSWKDSLITGKEFKIEFRCKRGLDGHFRWHLARALPLKNEEGEISKWYGTFTDIHDQRESLTKLANAKDQLYFTNKDLSQKNSELIKINNDLDNFIYTASHDLKAPVSNIEGLINALDAMLSLENQLSDDVNEIFTMIHKSIDRFKSTILDLTEITKIQKGDGSDKENLNLLSIIEDTKIAIFDLINKSESKIHIDATLHPSINFSKKNITSIVYNLLSNAIKYRSPDRAPEIFISTQELPDFIILSIKDNGLGMNLEKNNKLFSMFKRFHDHVEGTGIGLYLVKRMIDNAGGKIEVESQVGLGSTFKVYFKK